MANPKDEIRSLFLANYEISNHLHGGVSLHVSLMIDAVSKEVIGKGTVFQATNPPLNIPSILSGDYSYMCTMTSCNILVVAEGISPFAPLLMGAPVTTKNLSLRMSLEEDWKSGTATYRYLHNGEWIESGYQKVTLISETAGDMTNIDKLASHVSEQESAKIETEAVS